MTIHIADLSASLGFHKIELLIILLYIIVFTKLVQNISRIYSFSSIIYISFKMVVFNDY